MSARMYGGAATGQTALMVSMGRNGERAQKYRTLAQTETDPGKAATFNRLAEEAELGLLCLVSKRDRLRLAISNPNPDFVRFWT